MADKPETRRGAIVHVDVDGPVGDVVVEPDVTDVVVIVHHGRAVVGQQWTRPGPGGVIHGEELWQIAMKSAEPVALRRARRLALTALGRPSRAAELLDVAVVVCTKDRPDQLRGCLKSLQALNRPVELLVVDNASTTDATTRLCAELGVRCVSEPVPGQTSARNRGFVETTAQLVAFTDDDVIVAPDWLDELDADFDDPLTMIATGYIGPLELTHHDQVQFEAHGGFERHTAPRMFSSDTEPTMIAAGLAGAGANMVIRRELLERIGGFDIDFGPGSPVRTADDKLFFYRALEAGYRIRHSPERKVWHQHRADRQALLRIMQDYGLGEFAWTAHILRTRRDFTALAIWRWWAGHYLGDVRRRIRGHQTGVELSLTLAELRGVASAPGVLRRVSRLRRAGGGGPPAEVPRPRVQALATATAALALAPAVSVEAEPPSMTVAIPSHQRRDALKKVLERLAEQTVPRERMDVVVVLDGCTDGSAEMVRSLDLGLQVQLSELDYQGVSAARNLGIAGATHPIVVFLDDDIEPIPDWLVAFGRIYASTTEPTWVFGHHPPSVGSSWADQALRSWWSDHFARKAAPGHQWSMADFAVGNSAAPLSALRALGGFDTAFLRRREDFEIGFRFLQSGGACAYADDALAAHYATSGALTMLKNAFGEGEHDVTLVQTHPESALQLPLRTASVRQPGVTRLDRAAALLSDERAVRLADALERAGQRARWNRLMQILWLSRYRAGVRAGLEAHGATALPDLPIAPRIRVQLDDASREFSPLAGLAVPVGGVGGADLVFARGNHTVAAIPATLPGAQWSWDDVADRSAAALAPNLSLEGWPA